MEEELRQLEQKSKISGVDLEATCGLCMKTKFADGIGHTCYYCEKKVCARCGGKVTMRHADKVSGRDEVQWSI